MLNIGSRFPGLFYLALYLASNIQHLKFDPMQELIDKLKAEAGLTEDQAKQAITTIKNYVVEKFPMLEGAVSNVFGGD
jgi:hypothetical protein